MNFVSNAKWNSLSQFIKILVQVISLIYLAKIISPEDYGLMAMASVVINFGVLLRDLGTSSAIIQKKDVSYGLKNTVFWFNVAIGFFILILVVLSSSFISSFYGQPDLKNILILVSLVFPLSSCASLHLALMERDSRFKEISIVEVLSSVISLAVAIICAKVGLGVYSLIWQAISINLISAILFFKLSGWKPSGFLKIDIYHLKDIFGFSANLAGFNIVNYLSRSGDSFFIGKYMSPYILGNYNLAYRIMLFPLQSLTFVASRSLYPVLSKQQEDNYQVRCDFYNCIFLILMISMPLMIGVAMLSEPLIRVFFGKQWGQTAEILKWLAPTAIIQSVLSTTGAVFSAKGRTDTLLKLGIVGALLQVGSFIIGVQFSITTFAMCYLIANVINFFPVMFFLLRMISGTFFSFFKFLLPIIAASLFMSLFIFFINRKLYSFGNIDSISKLFFVSSAGALSYLLLLFFLSKKIRHFIFKKKLGSWK